MVEKKEQSGEMQIARIEKEEFKNGEKKMHRKACGWQTTPVIKAWH